MAVTIKSINKSIRGLKLLVEVDGVKHTMFVDKGLSAADVRREVLKFAECTARAVPTEVMDLIDEDLEI